MAELSELYAEMHELVAEQVLEDLRDGDRKARQEAMQLLKQNNVTATAAEGSTLKKLKNKLDFTSLADKVVPLTAPPSVS
tara:strand:- start:1819 stop:2058 length:240 start_codon:yes stop_codon:yes gene_type:complete